MKLTNAEKYKLIERYNAGESATLLCREAGIARSTFYTWVKPYTVTVTDTGRSISPHEFDTMKRHAEKMENINKVLKLVDCTVSLPLQKKLAALEQLHGQFSVRVLCEALDVPRGTFYNHILRNKRENSDAMRRRMELKPMIEEIFNENRQLFGAEKICALLQEKGVRTSERLIAELMKETGLRPVGRSAKRDYVKWKKGENKNVLQQDFQANKPNQIWVSDITQYICKERYYYIAAIIDLFSRKIIAYRTASASSTQLITKLFRQAYETRQPSENLIFHSDRGGQYTSGAFQKLLRDSHVTQSFSRSGKPHDNAVMESFFSYLKKEELYRRAYKSEVELKNGIKDYIQFYNSKRPHSTLNYKTPDKMEAEYSGA